MPPTLTRARLLEPGWDRDLVFETLPDARLEPTGDQVLLRIEACGVCHRDLIDRAGRFPFQQFPITPGHEAAGRVLEVGDAVTDWRPGDRVGTLHRDACGECSSCRAGETSLCQGASHVLGILADGGYASHLLVPQSALYALPGDLEPAAAAVLQCTFGTAWRDLVTLGRLEPGERVLVTGANGGVGSAAVQIAHRLGAEVTAVARSERHRAYLEALGAARVVIDPGDGFHREVEGIDLALDTVGTPAFNAALRTLRVGGRMVVVGNIVPERTALNLGYLITRGLTVTGGSGATRRDMAALLELHRARPLRIPIDAAMPLSRADEAQRRVRAGGLEGRVVLVP
jgi:acryloyl-coenzyme A reductase